jgi:hypothetical protein
MHALRRIFKYTPAAIVALLVVVWVGSVFKRVLVHLPFSTMCRVILVADGGVEYYNWPSGRTDPRTIAGRIEIQPNDDPSYYGLLSFSPNPPRAWATIPFPIMITVILPVAIGSVTCFRFRLWHYLAYTTLVAVELAYYLRWQE